MTYLTKMQERDQLLAEFLRHLREAPPGTRVICASAMYSRTLMLSALTNCGPRARPR